MLTFKTLLVCCSLTMFQSADAAQKPVAPDTIGHQLYLLANNKYGEFSIKRDTYHDDDLQIQYSMISNNGGVYSKRFQVDSYQKFKEAIEMLTTETQFLNRPIQKEKE